MTDDELADRIEGLLHEPTQVAADGIDLTATEVYKVVEPGRVDFGGGELEAADLEPHDRVRRNEDDDYQWWHLDAGGYVIEYNETLAGSEPVVLQPRDALLPRGASHPTVQVSTLPRMPLSVGGAGLRLKENARVTTARVP